MPLPADFLERVKDANRIDDVMRSYVTLQRTGRNLKCSCPFHSEKTPSCVIYQDNGSFYCFGCGAGGDVITFIMKIENLDYIEAVKFLADRSGIAMPESDYDDSSANEKKRLLEMNKAAAKFFYSNLKTPDGKVGLRYLIEKRGLKPETIKKFGLGIATNHWTALKNHMLALGYSEKELIKASLLNEKNGRTFDFFVNRVMFPIFDLRGNVIAFSGRTLDPESKGMKYLNSRETSLYKKSRTIFALNFAKNTSVKTKSLILCEGNVDVISLHQAGFDTAVATCGTAITPEHARLMSQYCDEVYLCYDSDAAGQKATQAAINLLAAAGLSAKVIKISGDGVKDVDDYIKRYGAERFKLLMDGSEGAVIFELNKCKQGLDLDSDLGKVEYLKRAVEVLANIESKIEREVYILRVAKEQDLKKEIIASEVEALLRKRRRAGESKEWKRISTGIGKRDDINPEALKYPKEAKAEEGIIAYCLTHPDGAKKVLTKISSQKFVTGFNRRIYEAIEACVLNMREITLTTLGSEFNADEMGRISYILASSREITIDEATLNDYIAVLVKQSESPDSSANEMTDDDFLAYVNKLSKSKK